MTALVFESGLNGMYWSMADFLIRIRARNDMRVDGMGFCAFSLYHLRGFFILYLLCMVLASLVFVIELAWFKIKAGNEISIRNFRRQMKF